MSESSNTGAAPVEAMGEIVAGKAPGMRARYMKDRLARWVVWVGGLGVIGALLLIFVYLLSEVAPLFASAEFEPRQSFSVPGDAGARTLFVASEEQAEVGLRVTDRGELVFFDLFDGAVRQTVELPGAGGIASVSQISAEQAELAVQDDAGGVLILRHRYRVSYPDDKRLITPEVEYPYGESPMTLTGTPVRSLVVRDSSDAVLLAAIDQDGSIVLKRNEKTESLFGDAEISEGDVIRFAPAVEADALLVDPQAAWLYAIDRSGGHIALYRIVDEPQLIGRYEVGAAVRQASFLAGGISVVLVQDNGEVSQWFPARKETGESYLARVREFALKDKADVTALGSEMRRRTFAVGDADGLVTLFYATSGARVGQHKLLDEPIELLSFNPRANYLLAVGADGHMRGFDVRNEHPEISMSALWGKVWYESYNKPEWLWQSSAATSDFEPKFSLMPLSFGTLKAAFYAMLFAIPLAILGAIFTANFMSAEMRQAVKPTVELMEALPTVILGFLAGLWLAPFIETNLPGVFLTLLLLPLSIPIFGFAWTRLPQSVRLRVPDGWEAAILIPVIVLVVWACFALAKPVEAVLFAGNMQSWMDHTLGIDYDQRNAMVVGVAMGIAVIPTIYSITEDAIFSVPKHLSLGSLALGATRWQTLVRVVMPTASPGIFSAVMIGLGRAVGETMIVLMATGNTAVMDPSPFQGLRTLSANIAVEMPESEVGSTHFRLLFLSGLVLFVFTFLFNTLAEAVRHRLRQKYQTI